MAHGELHRSDRIGWMRAAVLGANDGLISTGSLVVGVAALGAAPPVALVAAAALSWAVAGISLLLLLVLGAVAARLGGASAWTGALRVGFWGAVAMGVTALVGRTFGATV